MFCPRCATENDLVQNYCRHCGQHLAGARFDLETGGSRSLKELQKSERLIRSGIVTLLVFNLITLFVAIISVITTGLGPGILSIILDLVLGLAFGLPMILVGKSRHRRARFLLEGESRPSDLLPDATRELNQLATTGLSADLNRLPAQGSVTEHTTLELKRMK